MRALIARRDAADAALREIEALLAGGTLDEILQAELKRLADGITGVPEPVPDAIAVRVFGISERRRKHPLPMIRVRLANGERGPVEAETDFLGVGVLPLPDKRDEPRVRTIVEALDQRGAVVARQPIESGRREAPVVMFELAESPGLAASFRRGSAWLQAQDAARKRADELKALAEKALPRQREALITLRRRLDEEIHKALRREGGRDGHAEGEKPVPEQDRAAPRRRPREDRDPA